LLFIDAPVLLPPGHSNLEKILVELIGGQLLSRQPSGPAGGLAKLAAFRIHLAAAAAAAAAAIPRKRQ
jgi:hypothetical protein